jgi:hypothetical protein
MCFKVNVTILLFRVRHKSPKITILNEETALIKKVKELFEKVPVLLAM